MIGSLPVVRNPCLVEEHGPHVGKEGSVLLTETLASPSSLLHTQRAALLGRTEPMVSIRGGCCATALLLLRERENRFDATACMNARRGVLCKEHSTAHNNAAARQYMCGAVHSRCSRSIPLVLQSQMRSSFIYHTKQPATQTHNTIFLNFRKMFEPV